MFRKIQLKQYVKLCLQKLVCDWVLLLPGKNDPGVHQEGTLLRGDGRGAGRSDTGGSVGFIVVCGFPGCRCH